MKAMKSILIGVAFLLITNVTVFAQQEPRTTNLPGSQDYPIISSYKGAVIQNYEVTDYGQYVLGTGKPVEKDFRNHGKYFSKYIDLEGRIIRIQYLIPKPEGLFKVFKNYEIALNNAGLDAPYKTSDKKCDWSFWNEDLYNKDGGINAMQGDFYGPFGRDGFYYIAAQGLMNGKDIYVALFMNYGSEYGKEFILVSQDVIESKPMETGLVTVDLMNESIASKGHVAIYGIHFDTGKADIKLESTPALKEIADFIKSNPNKEYYIVGHTDNMGNFVSNMTLSANRAEAVINYLVNKLGVKVGQLHAHGVSSLAPVSSNNTDEGRAKNRRVEIVQ